MRFNLGFLLIITLLLSCSQDEDPVLVFNVPEEFSIEMREQLNPTNRDLIFDITSIYGFACEDITIDATYTRSGDNLSLSIQDIVKPDDCEEGANKANLKFNIGSLQNGEYTFNINLSEVVANTGMLSVSNDSYKIMIDEEEQIEGIVLPYTELRRMPNGSVWGKVEFNSDNMANIAQKFQEELIGLGMSNLDLKAGEYGFFSLDSELSMIWDTASPYNNTLSFILNKNQVTDQEIRNLIQQFQEEYGQSNEIDMDVFTWDGKEF